MLGPEVRDCAADEDDPGLQQSLSRGSSVSELVRSYDVSGKRDRSESGDSPAPMGKRGALDRGGEPSRTPPAPPARGSLKEHFDDALEKLEGRLTAFMSGELHELRIAFQSQFEGFNARLTDLEKHVEVKDEEIDELSIKLRESREELRRLQDRTEEAELISRLPCLVLSGGAMAARHAPPLPRPGLETVAPAGGPAGAPGGRQESAAAARADPAGPGGEAHLQRRGGSGPGAGESEDVCALVVNTLNKSFSGLNVSEGDID